MKDAKLLPHDVDISDVYQVDIEDFQPSEEQILFDRFKDESQDDLIGIIKVYRIPDSDQITNLYTAKTRYLFNVPVDQFGYEGLLDFIREKYGSGAYRLIGTMPKQKGTRFNKIVEIEAPIKDEPVIKTGDDHPRSESMSTMLSAFASIMKESQERTAELVRGLVGNQEPKDPMTQMGAMMGLMIQMKDFFGGGGKTESLSLLGEIEKHKAIAGLFGKDSETNESDVWVKLAEQFAPAIVSGLTVGQAAPQLDAPIPIIANPELTTDKAKYPEGETPEMQNLKTQAAALYGAAKNGVAPEKMANTILNLTPKDKLDALYAFMNDEHCVQTFVDAHPPLESYRDWLAKVQVSILGELVQDDFREPDTQETLHPGELTGDDELGEGMAPQPIVEKELTDTENKPKIAESEKAEPEISGRGKKGKGKAKAKASKKSAAKSKEPDD